MFFITDIKTYYNFVYFRIYNTNNSHLQYTFNCNGSIKIKNYM